MKPWRVWVFSFVVYAIGVVAGAEVGNSFVCGGAVCLLTLWATWQLEGAS